MSDPPSLETPEGDAVIERIEAHFRELREMALAHPDRAVRALRAGAHALLDVAEGIDGHRAGSRDPRSSGPSGEQNHHAFASLYDLVSLGCALHDSLLLVSASDCRIVEANEPALAMYGYDRETLVSMTVFDLRAPDTRGGVQDQMARASHEGMLFETYHLRASGETFPVEVNSRLVEVAGDRVLVSVVRDLTARHQAEKLKAENEAKLHAVYEAMTEGLAIHEIVFDAFGKPVDYVLLDANRAFESTLGLRRASIIGRKATDVYGTPEAPYLDVYADVARTGVPTRFETLFAPMQKTFSITVISPGKNFFATIFEDITERKRMEADLRAQHRHLEQAQALAHVGSTTPSLSWPTSQNHVFRRSWTIFKPFKIANPSRPKSVSKPISMGWVRFFATKRSEPTSRSMRWA